MNNFMKIHTKNHFFLFYKGRLIYKKWLKTNERSSVFGQGIQPRHFKLR